jgi:hypothetical protein
MSWNVKRLSLEQWDLTVVEVGVETESNYTEIHEPILIDTYIGNDNKIIYSAGLGDYRSEAIAEAIDSLKNLGMSNRLAEKLDETLKIDEDVFVHTASCCNNEFSLHEDRMACPMFYFLVIFSKCGG